MEESGYRIYLYPHWFIVNAVVSLAAFAGGVLIASQTSSLYLLLFLLLLIPVFAGITILNIIPLFQLRKPCITCTAAGIRVHLQFQPKERHDNSYLGTLRAFIPWENIHGIHLLKKRKWYARQARVLRINYSINPHASQASRYCEIFIHQLNVHPESMYNTLIGFYGKYGPVSH